MIFFRNTHFITVLILTIGAINRDALADYGCASLLLSNDASSVKVIEVQRNAKAYILEIRGILNSQQLYSADLHSRLFMGDSPLIKALRILARYEKYRDDLLPILEDSLVLIEGLPEGHLTEETTRAVNTLTDVVKVFFESPVYEPEIPVMVESLLKSDKGHFYFDNALIEEFRLVKDNEVRQKIIKHFLNELADSDRNLLAAFARTYPGTINPAIVPIALGTQSKLERLKTRTRSVPYPEWQDLGWVKDSKSIQTFKKPFFKVTTQASAVFFDITEGIRDISGLREAFSKIRARGDERILESLGKIYDNFGEEARLPDERPRLGGGQISITNLELYWVVTSPRLLSKTSFYLNAKPLSDEKRKAF